MTFNGTGYPYGKDAQGDIVGIFDKRNNKVYSYLGKDG